MLTEALAAALARLSPLRRSVIAEGITPEIAVPTRHGTIRVYCPGQPAAMRAVSFHNKEPETLAWIDSLPPGVLWDVGANIGLYSLYAAKRGLRVFAFEPSPMNFAVLCRNVAINKVPVETYCVALGDQTGLGHLHVRTLRFGQADAGLYAEEPLEVSTMMFRADDFPAPKPDYLKIDIDGAEDRLLAGAPKTLAGARQIQIECGGTYGAVASSLGTLGFAHQKPSHHIRNVLFQRT